MNEQRKAELMDAAARGFDEDAVKPVEDFLGVVTLHRSR
jgi:hypothetical protein